MNSTPNKDMSPLDKQIAEIYAQMEHYMPYDEEYAKMVTQLTELTELKAKKKAFAVSPDTLVVVGANLAGLLLVLNYERLNIVTSKAMGMILKTKI